MDFWEEIKGLHEILFGSMYARIREIKEIMAKRRVFERNLKRNVDLSYVSNF